MNLVTIAIKSFEYAPVLGTLTCVTHSKCRGALSVCTYTNKHWKIGNCRFYLMALSLLLIETGSILCSVGNSFRY